MIERRPKIGDIGKAVLMTVAVAGVITVAAALPGVAIIAAPFLKKKKYSPKQVILRNVDSLIKHGLLVQQVDKAGHISLKLTKLGKFEVGIRGLDTQIGRSKVWDGLWRVIVFDIPESKSKVRYELRRAVGLYGFYKLQQSVWVYPYPCEDFVKLIKQRLGIASHVLYLTSNYIENDKYLRKEFDL
jgi:DNA-binding transcriptional regulator PaaX